MLKNFFVIANFLLSAVFCIWFIEQVDRSRYRRIDGYQWLLIVSLFHVFNGFYVVLYVREKSFITIRKAYESSFVGLYLKRKRLEEIARLSHLEERKDV